MKTYIFLFFLVFISTNVFADVTCLSFTEDAIHSFVGTGKNKILAQEKTIEECKRNAKNANEEAFCYKSIDCVNGINYDVQSGIECRIFTFFYTFDSLYRRKNSEKKVFTSKKTNEKLARLYLNALCKTELNASNGSEKKYSGGDCENIECKDINTPPSKLYRCVALPNYSSSIKTSKTYASDFAWDKAVAEKFALDSCSYSDHYSSPTSPCKISDCTEIENDDESSVKTQEDCHIQQLETEIGKLKRKVEEVTEELKKYKK